MDFRLFPQMQGGSPQDQQSAEQQGWQQLGIGLLGAAGQPGVSFNQGLAYGLGQGLQGYRQAVSDIMSGRKAEQEAQIREAELQQAQQQSAMAQAEQQARQAYKQMLAQQDPQLAALFGVAPGVVAQSQAPMSQAQQAQLAMEEARAQQQQANADRSFGLDAARLELARQEAAMGGMEAPGFKDIMALRKEYTSQSTPYVGTRDAFKRVMAAKEGPVGDVSLIYGYMKMLDPESVVREGEYATAQNTTGAAGQIANLYNRVLKGDRLNPEQRSQFKEQAKEVYNAQFSSQQELAKSYEGLAQRGRVDPIDVLSSVELLTPDQIMPPPVAAPMQAAASVQWGGPDLADPLGLRKR